MDIDRIVRRNIRRILNEDNTSHPAMQRWAYGQAKKFAVEIHRKLNDDLANGNIREIDDGVFEDRLSLEFKYGEVLSSATAVCFLVGDNSKFRRDKDHLYDLQTRSINLYCPDTTNLFFDLVVFFNEGKNYVYPLDRKAIDIIAHEVFHYLDDHYNHDNMESEQLPSITQCDLDDEEEMQNLNYQNPCSEDFNMFCNVLQIPEIKAYTQGLYAALHNNLTQRLSQQYANGERNTSEIIDYMHKIAQHNNCYLILMYIEKALARMEENREEYKDAYYKYKMNFHTNLPFEEFYDLAHQRYKMFKVRFGRTLQRIKEEFIPDERFMGRVAKKRRMEMGSDYDYSNLYNTNRRKYTNPNSNGIQFPKRSSVKSVF